MSLEWFTYKTTLVHKKKDHREMLIKTIKTKEIIVKYPNKK